MRPFVFSSPGLPANKAKQLQKAFPFLKLSNAQEATARALGYASWFECLRLGRNGQPSLPDQVAGMNARIVRYYHQAGVLTSIGITPGDADVWVRAWGLTGRPTLSRKNGTPLYYLWSEAIKLIESGELSEEEIKTEWPYTDYSKYPDTDRPERVCDGVILGPCGKYPYYAVDPAIQAQIPVHLRGSANKYHIEDGAEILAMTIPGFPKEALVHQTYSKTFNRVQHEWHFGSKHPDSDRLLVPELEAACLAHSERMMVISQRAMPTPNGECNFEEMALACLKGLDFATYVRSKGKLDPSKVVWYRNIPTRLVCSGFRDWLLGLEWEVGVIPLPIFEEASLYKPSLPVYSYPFKFVPMGNDEYDTHSEWLTLLPLDQDYEDDGDDDDRDNGEGPQEPRGPTLESISTSLMPA